MAAKRNMPTSLITLTSDFGLADTYVAAMKGAILREIPHAQIVDVTHQVPPQNVLIGSIALERAIASFGAGTVHLAVVDPGVGSGRRILVVKIGSQLVVCPDNGLITWAWRRIGKAQAHKLDWRPKRSSDTFHGRDIMAPAAAMLAVGTPVHEIASPIDDPILLKVAPIGAAAPSGEVIHIDRFGNAMTNVPRQSLRIGATITAGGRNLGKVRRTYADVLPGAALALIGSADLLEIAVRNGSAAATLALSVGDHIRINYKQ